MTKYNGPTWMYDPNTGEGRVFTDSADVPKGWLDHVPAASERKPMTRDEIVAALEAGDIKFDHKAKVAELRDLLTDSVVTALEAAKIEHDPKADVRDLLALLTG